LGTMTVFTLPLLDVPHVQALGCYTDCHNNTFCSNDAYSISCTSVSPPLFVLALDPPPRQPRSPLPQHNTLGERALGHITRTDKGLEQVTNANHCWNNAGCGGFTVTGSHHNSSALVPPAGPQCNTPGPHCVQRATPAHSVLAAQALVFGLVSATSRLWHGDSNGWTQVFCLFCLGCWEGRASAGPDACRVSAQDFKTDSTAAASAVTPVGACLLASAFAPAPATERAGHDC